MFPASDSAIRTVGLCKDYGARRALDDLTIDVPNGVIAGFVGPNGAGKTTTIRILLGLIAPTAGSAGILGVPVTRPGDYLGQVGALIESPAFYPTLSGRANLQALARLGGFRSGRVAEVLDMVRLSDRADDQYRTYSLGMRQRLGIAAALLPEPRLLVRDEPVNGLDPSGITEVRALLRSLADHGVTVFVSSHLLSEVEQIAGWLVMITRGRLVFDGPTERALALQNGVLVVHCENGNPRIVSSLAARAGYASTVDDDGQLTIEAPADFAGELNRQAMGAGVTLSELRFQQPTLEEMFFAMAEEAEQ
jgi:ABC-2 type transport system ATP-binding protein